ncbi:uncharacterized protein PAE49_000788 isoform 2-T2 [Odontesthes bonariensis]|uniref:uncharacterized protein LOC142373841 isoform X2 n=1 Tax=Odontesthes bonariensis TaxID=219752 RepID=UPI003F5825C4
MKAHWWSCVLGLLCMPAEVLLNNLAASQNPSTISLLRVNSSLETTCFTSLSNPLSLTLRRQFQNEEVVHLHFKNEQIKKTTTAQKFVGRVHITEELQVKSAISLQLSQLGLEDTDLYYCRWTLLKSANLVTVTSNGTIIIVRESAPQDQCEDTILDLTLISLSVTALSVTLSLFIGALIFKCKRVSLCSYSLKSTSNLPEL